MIGKVLNEQQLKAVCDILAETDSGYTKKDLKLLLQQSGIEIVPDGSGRFGDVYKIDLNKREWLYKCLAIEINKKHSYNNVYKFFEKALNPVAFIDEKDRDKYTYFLENINRVLLLAGLKMTNSGKLIEVVQAETLEEVDRRVNNLQRQLYNRAIHSEVQKYCISKILRHIYRSIYAVILIF